tara:strand:+ start:18 stop:830 length:813 start_codon:yes stop_codon:yes gene_type:complete
MADWGGIARAVEEGLLDAESGSSTSGGGLRDIAEALTGSNFAGFKVRDIFDKDRWTRRERVNQGRRLEETGVPDYTYDYNPTDRGITTGLGSSDISSEALPDPRLSPREQEELLNIRQWGTQNPNMPGSMALDPTWAGGLRGAGLGAEMTQGQRRDLSGLSRDSKFATGTVPGNVTGTRAYLPGRLSVGEARRERELRNRYNEAREASFDDENYRARMRGNPQRQGGEFLRNIYDSSGPTPPRSHPDWQAIEEDMAMREMADRLQGRDDR